MQTNEALFEILSPPNDGSLQGTPIQYFIWYCTLCDDVFDNSSKDRHSNYTFIFVAYKDKNRLH